MIVSKELKMEGNKVSNRFKKSLIEFIIIWLVVTGIDETDF